MTPARLRLHTWTRGRRALGMVAGTTLVAAVALGTGGPAHAEDGRWTLQLEPMVVEAYGHDQHVLTIHEVDLGSTPPGEIKTAVNLDSDAGPAYRGELRYGRGQWAWGVDFFWFNTTQNIPDRAAAADAPGGGNGFVVFEVADQSFTSTDPSEVLYYSVLEDTDLAVWTVDFYAVRTLAEKADGGVHLQLGLRAGDFDNDYRAVVGVQGFAGSRLDASSNYDLMMGPVVGLAGDVHRGRHCLEGYLGQSVLFGSVELTSRSRAFNGPFIESPSYVAQELFRKQQDVAIPISELRIKWTYRLGRHIALGLGLNASAWWDVSVPPGVIPGEDGDETLHENTIVFAGALAALELTF